MLFRSKTAICMLSQHFVRHFNCLKAFCSKLSQFSVHNKYNSISMLRRLRRCNNRHTILSSKSSLSLMTAMRPLAAEIGNRENVARFVTPRTAIAKLNRGQKLDISILKRVIFNLIVSARAFRLKFFNLVRYVNCK